MSCTKRQSKRSVYIQFYVILLCDAFDRVFIVEAKVSGVDDVLGFGVACELVELAKVAYPQCELSDTTDESLIVLYL